MSENWLVQVSEGNEWSVAAAGRTMDFRAYIAQQIISELFSYGENRCYVSNYWKFMLFSSIL